MNNSVDDKLRNQTRGAVHDQTGATYHPKRLVVDLPLQSGTGHPAMPPSSAAPRTGWIHEERRARAGAHANGCAHGAGGGTGG